MQKKAIFALVLAYLNSFTINRLDTSKLRRV
nr:MAG TPA: hypothetical protein [Caudoviricetes sp.]